jgi:hypothetical protein
LSPSRMACAGVDVGVDVVVVVVMLASRQRTRRVGRS